MKRHIKSDASVYNSQLHSIIDNFDPFIADVKAIRTGEVSRKTASIPIRIADYNSDFLEWVTLWYKITDRNEWDWYWDPTAVSLYDYDEYTDLAEKITESPEVEFKVSELLGTWYKTYFNYD